MAGGLLICAAPLQAAVETGEGTLSLSLGLAGERGVQPVWRDDTTPELSLRASFSLAGSEAGGLLAESPQPPYPQAQLPLRLAQAFDARRRPGVQQDWPPFYDSGLNLQSSRSMNMPGAAGIGRPDNPAGVAIRQGLSSAPDNGGETPAPAGGNGRGITPNGGSSQGGRGLAGLGWTIPPIRWGGNLGGIVRQTSSDSGERSLGQVFTANLRGSSYIYAPWMAAVSGNIGVVAGTESMSGGSSGGTVSADTSSSSKSSNWSLVGSGNLDLFPQSRFPFSATLNRSDSRASSTITTTDYTDTRFGMRQSYRSEDGAKYATASFDHSTITANGAPADTVDSLDGSLSLPIGNVANNFSARFSTSQRGASGENATLFSFNTSHSLTPANNFSMQGYSNFTDNSLRYISNGALSESRGQYLQLGASASWQPEFEDDDDLPLTLTGSVSYLDSQSGGGFGNTQSQMIGTNLAAYYRFSPNLTVSGSGSFNHLSSSAGQTQLLGLLTGSIAYMGNPLTFGNYSYTWNTGANASYQMGSGTTTSSNVFASAQASHSLGRTFIISGTDSISVNASQSISFYENQQAGNASSLSNTAMASYRLGLGDKFNGSVSASLSDVETTGVSSQHYDSLNLGFNGFGQLSTRSSASVNLSFNWSDQRMHTTFDSLGQQTNTQRMSLMGSASYNHMRFAGVPGLRYSFLFNADTRLRDERLFGNANAPLDRARFSVENRLDYRIGRLDMRLSQTINDQGGKKNALLFFQVSRQFGTN